MAQDFDNIVDYVRTQLDTFRERDLCRVDSLVFSVLSYFRLPEGVADTHDNGVPIRDLYRAEWFEPMCSKHYDPKSSVELLAACAASPRFRDVVVSGYVSRLNEIAEQQFSAMTFSLYPRATFIAFRGTDNTLVGWKEDFNISFQTKIPSQKAALRYLERVSGQTDGRLWCGGHSKGGNLAVYAGVMSQPTTRERIVRCYSHDGPGFSSETMADPRWKDASGLVDKTIPQSSLIGMVFEGQENNFSVVKSHSVGFAQHDPFSWEVDWRDFAIEEKIDLGARHIDTTVNEWLNETSAETREKFVDAIFKVIGAAGHSSFSEIKSDWRTAFPRMATAAATLDPEDRQVVIRAAKDVLRAMVPSVRKGDERKGDGGEEEAKTKASPAEQPADA